MDFQGELMSWTNILKILLIAFALDFLGRTSPETVYLLFAYPAAFLASLFFGVHMVILNSQDIFIPLHHPIHVIPACSAYSFFCLLVAMIVVDSCRFQKLPRMIASFIVALPAAYIITIFINSLRIICAYYANEAAKVLLPSNFQSAMHQGVGIAVFLTTLMVVSVVLERKCHERSSQ
jgi:exosortase K